MSKSKLAVILGLLVAVWLVVLVWALVARDNCPCQPPRPDGVPQRTIDALGSDQSMETRLAAIHHISTGTGLDSVQTILEPLLDDEEPNIRFAVAAALLEAGGEVEQYLPVLLATIKADPSCIVMFRYGVPTMFRNADRDDWDYIAMGFAGLLKELPADSRFELLQELGDIGITYSNYTEEIAAHIDPAQQTDSLGAGELLVQLGADGAAGIPAMLSVWDGDDYTAHVIQGGMARHLASFGPLLADYCPELEQRIRDNPHRDLVTCLKDIGPGGEPLVPVLVEIFNARDYQAPDSKGGVWDDVLRSLGAIGPGAARAAVPLCLDYYGYLKETGQSTAAPVAVLGMLGNASPRVLKVLEGELDSDDDYVRLAALKSTVQLAPDDARYAELLRNEWKTDGGYDANDKVALALAYGGNLDLVVPYVRECFSYQHSQLHATSVAGICRVLGPDAADAGPQIAQRLRMNLPSTIPANRQDDGIHGIRICLECLAAIGPDAAPALPVVRELRESARPCDVAYIDEVIAAITPVETVQ